MRQIRNGSEMDRTYINQKSFRKRIVKAIECCLQSSENGLKITDLNDLQDSVIFVRAITVQWWGKVLTVVSCAVSGRLQRENKFKQL